MPVHLPAEVTVDAFTTPWNEFVNADAEHRLLPRQRPGVRRQALVQPGRCRSDELPFTGLDGRTHTISGSGSLIGRTGDIADSDYTYTGDAVVDGDRLTFSLDQQVDNALGVGHIYTTGSFDLATATGTQTVVDCQGPALLCSGIEIGSTAFYTAQDLDASDPDAITWQVDVAVDLGGTFGIADSTSTFTAIRAGCPTHCARVVEWRGRVSEAEQCGEASGVEAGVAARERLLDGGEDAANLLAADGVSDRVTRGCDHRAPMDRLVDPLDLLLAHDVVHPGEMVGIIGMRARDRLGLEIDIGTQIVDVRGARSAQRTALTATRTATRIAQTSGALIGIHVTDERAASRSSRRDVRDDRAAQGRRVLGERPRAVLVAAETGRGERQFDSHDVGKLPSDRAELHRSARACVVTNGRRQCR